MRSMQRWLHHAAMSTQYANEEAIVLGTQPPDSFLLLFTVCLDNPPLAGLDDVPFGYNC